MAVTNSTKVKLIRKGILTHDKDLSTITKPLVYLGLFFDQTLPRRCLLCRLSSDTAGPLCSGCEQDLPWLDHCCSRCAEPLPIKTGQTTCGQCQKHPPAFQHCFAPLRYEFPLDSLIQSFKDSADIPKVRLLADLFIQRWQLSAQASQPPELLIPVPLHRNRLYQRGFNQSLELADRLGRLLSIPVNNQACQRRVDTPHQVGLEAKQRRKNLANAFRVNASRLTGVKHLALVDDVVTTGTTAQLLARELVNTGVERVDIWCLARTPRDKHR